MKLKANRQELHRLAGIAATVAKARSPKPVLECALLTATADAVTLAATDLEQAVRAKGTLVQVEAEGQTAVNAELLHKLLGTLSDDTVDISVEDGHLYVRTAASKHKLPTLNPADFPPVPTLEGVALPVDAAGLAKCLAQVLPCTADAGTRYVFNGVLIEPGTKRLTFAATDGRRLAVATLDGIFPECGHRAVFPREAVRRMVKLLGTGGDAVLTIGERQAGIECDGITFVTILLEGEFPDWREIVPKDPDVKCRAGRKDLLAAIQTLRVQMPDGERGARFEFARKSGLRMQVAGYERGEGTIEFPMKVDGDLTIGFRAEYIEDALVACEADEVAIGLTKANRPVLIEAGNSQHVIMPVNSQ